ncbi:hypothetical protein H097_08390 [Pseudomonas sp. FH4]|nr:hypothetical protein H097_08390 [Pseudomonas sp. FH4]
MSAPTRNSQEYQRIFKRGRGVGFTEGSGTAMEAFQIFSCRGKPRRYTPACLMTGDYPDNV